MAEKLGFEAAFMQAYSQRVRALPGRGRFRTGVSLRAPCKRLTEPRGDSSSEDRFILFLSFPYFGRYSKGVGPSPESESVTLLNFKRLKVHASDRSTLVSEGDGDDTGKTTTKGKDDKGKTPAEEDKTDIGEILVHQARYMIFDNRKLYLLPRC